MQKPAIKFCPQCKSTDVDFDISDAGSFDVCRNCGYRLPSFPEKKTKSTYARFIST